MYMNTCPAQHLIDCLWLFCESRIVHNIIIRALTFGSAGNLGLKMNHSSATVVRHLHKFPVFFAPIDKAVGANGLHLYIYGVTLTDS